VLEGEKRKDGIVISIEREGCEGTKSFCLLFGGKLKTTSQPTFAENILFCEIRIEARSNGS
jgi:hypothetical protein